MEIPMDSLNECIKNLDNCIKCLMLEEKETNNTQILIIARNLSEIRKEMATISIKLQPELTRIESPKQENRQIQQGEYIKPTYPTEDLDRGFDGGLRK